jgi:DNA-binding transcriptional ArsR family regulator
MPAKNKNRFIRGLDHQLRRSCLDLLYEGPSSPSRLSVELGENLGKVAYHVRVLRDTDLIELVTVRRVRGADEHIYRPLYPRDLIEAVVGTLRVLAQIQSIAVPDQCYSLS